MASEGAKQWEKAMKRNGAWADQVTIAAAASYLKRCIFVIAYNPGEKKVHYELVDEKWLQESRGKWLLLL